MIELYDVLSKILFLVSVFYIKCLMKEKIGNLLENNISTYIKIYSTLIELKLNQISCTYAILLNLSTILTNILLSKKNKISY